MAQTASDILVDTLIDWGVDTVFGIPGDGVNGIIEALRQKRDKIRFIQVRHEEAAAFAACGYAKFTGKLGCCIATSGPGGIHLLNGLYDAKLDGVPVLAITGLQFHDLLATYTQQDVELDKLFMDVAKYNVRVMGPAHVENAVELACRTALAYRGVAHVTIPVDFQSQPLKKAARSARNLPHHVSEIWADSAHVPTDEALRRAAELLNAGKKITILAGRGALGARKELEEVARPGARGADRARPAEDRLALSRRDRPRRRQHPRAAPSHPAARPQCRARLARSGATRQGRVAEADGGARHAPRHADEAAGCGA
jgi:pyruvate dehydrogenase (quinone)/pyruvate oxidase